MVMAGVLMAACNNEEQNGQMSEADKLIENTQKTKNYPELLKVVDSLETIGRIVGPSRIHVQTEHIALSLLHAFE